MLQFGLGLGLGLGLVLGLESWLGLGSNAHLRDAQCICSKAQIDQMRLTKHCGQNMPCQLLNLRSLLLTSEGSGFVLKVLAIGGARIATLLRYDCQFMRTERMENWVSLSEAESGHWRNNEWEWSEKLAESGAHRIVTVCVAQRKCKCCEQTTGDSWRS